MNAKDAGTIGLPLTPPPPSPVSWVEKAPGVCGGDARIRKTRITVWGLVERRNMGLSDDEILDHLPSLTQADLEAAWEYYEQHREEIDQAIRENDEAPSHCPVLDNPLIRVNRPPRS